MTYPQSRKDQNGNLLGLENCTTEQLKKISSDYGLSQEGNVPEIIARIREYEFKEGKTVQPSDQQSSQSSTQPYHGDRQVSDKHNNEQNTVATKKPLKADEATLKNAGVDPKTGESLPGKSENDAAFNESHGATQVADVADNRNDRTFRNPQAAGMGTGKEADKLRKERTEDQRK